MVVPEAALQRQPVQRPLILDEDRVEARSPLTLEHARELGDLIRDPVVEPVLDRIGRSRVGLLAVVVPQAVVAHLHVVCAGHVREMRLPRVRRDPSGRFVAARRTVRAVAQARDAPALLRDGNQIVRWIARRGSASPSVVVRAPADVEQRLVRQRVHPVHLRDPVRRRRIGCRFGRRRGASTDNPAVRVVATGLALRRTGPPRAGASPLFVPEAGELVVRAHLPRQSYLARSRLAGAARRSAQIRFVVPRVCITGIEIGPHARHRHRVALVAQHTEEPQPVSLDRAAQAGIDVPQLEQVTRRPQACSLQLLGEVAALQVI